MRGRLLAAGLVLLLLGLGVVLTGVWQERMLLLLGLLPLPVAGWLLQRGLDRGEEDS